jgi:hypothetical protein
MTKGVTSQMPSEIKKFGDKMSIQSKRTLIQKHNHREALPP